MIAVVVAIVVVFVLLIRGCVSGCSSQQEEAGGQQVALEQSAIDELTNDARSQDRQPVVSEDGAVPDQGLLAELIGDDLAAQLVEEAQTDKDLYWIASHPEAYESEGSFYQAKFLRLATTEPTSIPWARAFPDVYPMEEPTGSKDSGIPNDTRIPHLYQWDVRWGNTVYSSSAFGLTGCNPTAMAMVYQGLTGNTDMSPYDMGRLADELGYMDETQGTSYGFLYAAAEQFGITAWELGVDGDAVIEVLQNGGVVIGNMGTGTFSRGNGHYLVLTGLTEDGQVIMNDPNSAVNSEQVWDINFLVEEAKGFHAFTL